MIWSRVCVHGACGLGLSASPFSLISSYQNSSAQVTVTGIIRNGEKAGQFVPRNDFKSCTWHYINTAELAEAAGLDPGTPLVEAVIGTRTETQAGESGGQDRVRLRASGLQK